MTVGSEDSLIARVPENTCISDHCSDVQKLSPEMRKCSPQFEVTPRKYRSSVLAEKEAVRN